MVLPSCVAAVALLLNAVSATIYLSPTGNDTNSGTSPSSAVATPHRASDLATKTADRTVSIAAGTYTLSSPLLLNSSHSGMHWVAPNGSASLSGGVLLGPWQPVANSPNGLRLVEAVFPASGQDRHLFVNGRRATRTRLSADAFAKLFQSSKISDSGYTLSDQATLPAWERSGQGAELVFPQSTSPWTEPRCAVASARRGQLSMVQPCWHNLRYKACGQGAKGQPGYVENVGPAYISQEGDWAVNRTSGTVVYALRVDEEAATISAVMPVLELLVSVSNAANITFERMRFEHASWLRPGQADGYVEQQTGCCAVGTNPLNSDCNHDTYWSVKSPGNVAVVDSNNVVFKHCELTRMGGVGLDFTRTTSSEVSGCYVHDISGSGIQIGSFAPGVTGLADGSLDRHNAVRDTIVTRAAVEFSGAAGINVGYTQGTVLEHNEVSNLTYVGITVGWGWSRHSCYNCTNAGWNTIRANRVHDYKQTLNDGGGIYMLGPQNGSVIHHNWVFNQGTASSGALYPDEGSAYSAWYLNVVSNIGKSEWLHLWTGSIHNVTVSHNFADTSVYLNHGTNC